MQCERAREPGASSIAYETNMYRVGRRAFAHGNYIRPTYVAVWREASRQAAHAGVSLSEFISHALFVFMTGSEPEGGKLHGINPVEIEKAR